MHDPLSDRRPQEGEEAPPTPPHRMPEGSFLFERGVPIILIVLGVGTLILIAAALIVVLSTGV